MSPETIRRMIRRTVLPRVRGKALWPMIGMERPEPTVDTAWLAESAAAAVGLGALASDESSRRARVAAMALAAEVVRPGELDRLLGVSAATGRRLRLAEAEPALVAAIGRQCAVRRALAAREEPADRTGGL